MATNTATAQSSEKSEQQETSERNRAPQNGGRRGTDRQGTTEVSSGASGVDQPAAERGTTSLADSVVEKIAGMAAREVSGVHALGGGFARSLGAVRDRTVGGRTKVSRGVKVEVGQRQTAVDLDVVTEYGVPIPDITEDIRENVIGSLERMTGLEVVEVNITVHDVHLPDEESEDEEGGSEGEPRVQ